MKKESQRPWPEVMFYAVFGEHGPESTIKPPKDFDLSLEFLMRNKLSEEDVMFLRERYEKGLSERAIAEQHNLTIGIARGKINKAIKRLRHPSRSKYLRYGLVEATKREVERGRVPAYEEGYQAGYQDCKDEFLMRDQNRKERIEKIRCTLPEDIGNLGLSNHAYGMLRRAGISRTETLLMLTKPQIKEIRGIGRKAADEIFAHAETLGFPLEDGTSKKYE